MSTQAATRMPAHNSSRHHPYAHPSHASHASSSSQRQAQPHQRKWTNTERSPQRDVPSLPSPPRSHRDHSESPPVGLGAAFGGKEGGKWWDEELPTPPASLSSILDSFRRSGEGDRDLLLAILGAKKAEEERLTSLIQTRLTILQARLSVHTAAASLPTPADSPMSFPPTAPVVRAPSPPHRDQREQARSNGGHPMTERTPSLTSRGSASAASNGPTSPIMANTYETPSFSSNERDRKMSRADGFHHLPPPANLWRRHSPSADLPLLDRSYVMSGEGRHRTDSKDARSPVSPRSEGHSGLEMLLDAGRRVETRGE